MKSLAGVVLTSAIVMMAGCSPFNGGTGDVYVSPSGDDAASGLTPRASVKTLARAVEVARAKGGPATILLADGTYESEKPFVLTSADRHLTFEAAPEARPVVSGGLRLKDWTTDARGWWHARVPAGMVFSQLYVNGTRRLRPYLPRKGYYFVEKSGYKAKGAKNECFHACEGDFPIGDNPDMEVCMFHVWAMSRSLVTGYDAATRLVTLGIKPFESDFSAVNPTRWYRFDNVKTALGEPGDWYLDRAKNEVIYVPKAGETPANCEVTAARHQQAVLLLGAEDISWRGITFAYANYDVKPDGNYSAQAASNQPGAVHAEESKGIHFRDCAFLHTGAYGAVFTKRCEDCTLDTCELADLGAGGVRIGDGWETTRKVVCSRNCAVRDCIIEGGGRVDPAGVGVWIGVAQNNHVAHNTIHNLYYSGISAGWTWAIGGSTCGNVLEWNHIYDIGQHVLSDMGGIYLLGKQPGTVERYNHIHHVTRARNCAFGVYFDSGTSLVSVSNNVVHDCGDCNWFMAQISASNRVVNNIFACGPRNQLNNPPRKPESKPSTFARNIVVWDEGRFMPNQPGEDVVHYEGNIYQCLSEDSKPDKDPRGFTAGVIPFRNLKARDFTFTDGGAFARAHGFAPFSIEGCGRTSARKYTVGMPEIPAVFTQPGDAPEFKVNYTFEDHHVNDMWGLWVAFPPTAAGKLLKVVEGGAANGKKCFEVTDALDSWVPHCYLGVARTKGLQKVSFNLKRGKNASLQFEVRDGDFGIHAPGPEILIRADGTMLGRGQKTMQIPENVWCNITLEFMLGKERTDNTFTVRVMVPGEKEEHVFKGLPLHKNFRKVGWLGFQSIGKNGTKYWIDDFKLTP